MPLETTDELLAKNEEILKTAREANDFHAAHGAMEVISTKPDGTALIRCVCGAELALVVAPVAPEPKTDPGENTPNVRRRVSVNDGGG